LYCDSNIKFKHRNTYYRRQTQWYTPVVPATKEAEEGEQLEPRSLKQPGQHSKTPYQKREKRNNKSIC
jgi:hypothetical protein